MKDNKRLALEIGLVAVIIYLWLGRCRKSKAVEKAKDGANVAPVADKKTASPTAECGQVEADCMGTDTSKKGQLEKTITVEETSSFNGMKSKPMKAQYFR